MPIAICADLHAGHVGRDTKAAALATLARIATERQLDAIVVAGDTFDDARLAMGHSNTAGDILASVIDPLMLFGGLIYVVEGNHDRTPGHLSALEPMKRIPHFNVIERAQTVVVGGFDIAFWPWVGNEQLLTDPAMRALGREEFHTICKKLRHDAIMGLGAELASHDEKRLKLLCGHAEVQGAVNRYIQLPEGTYNVLEMETFVSAGFNAVALGHYHKRQSIEGMDCYVGALTQNNAGEEGNPTGFPILYEDGRREWIHVDSPRFYTVKSIEALEVLRPTLRPDDNVKLQCIASDKPAVLPDGVRFEPVLEPKEVRTRTEGVESNAPPAELLSLWYGLQKRTPSLPDLQALLSQILTQTPLRSESGTYALGIQAVRQIILRGIGPHADTVIDMPESMDGAIAFWGEEGSGKSFAIEAIYAVFFGSWPSYPGPAYDNVPAGYEGIATVEVVFDSGGQRYRAIRRIHPKQKKTEAVLFRVEDGRDVPMTGTGQRTFQAEVEGLVGDPDELLATAFQQQDDQGSIVDLDPSDRMALMRRWSGADAWEDPCASAKALLDTLQAERQTKQALLSSAVAEASQVPDIADEALEAGEEREAAEATLATVTEQGLAQAEVVAGLKHQIGMAEVGRRQYDDVASQISTVVLDLKSKHATIMRLEGAEQDRPTLLGQQALHRGKREALEALQTEQDSIGQQAAVLSGLRQQFGTAERALQQATNRATIEHQQAIQGLKSYAAQQTGRVRQAEQDLRHKLLALETEVERLERREALMERAGCKAAPLPCSFIDDAVSAMADLPAKRQERDELSALMEFESYAHEERDALKATEAELAALVASGPVLGFPELEQQISVLEQQVTAAAAAVPPSRNVELAVLRTDLEELRQVEGKLARLDTQAEHLQAEREAERQRRLELAELEAKLSSMAVSDEAIFVTALREAESEIAALRLRAREAQQTVSKMTLLLGRLEERLAVAIAAQQAERTLMAEIGPLDSAVQVCSTLIEFLSPRGVPQLIIDLALPRLNQIVKDLLTGMEDSHFLVEFRTTRELKDSKRGSREGFFVDVTDPYGTRDVKRHSGGEKSRLRKTIRLTFGLWQAERRGQHHKVFCLDEPTLGMSPMGAKRFVSTIFSLLDQYRQVWIVSHDPVVLQSCPVGYRFWRPNQACPTQVENQNGVVEPISEPLSS